MWCGLDPVEKWSKVMFSRTKMPPIVESWWKKEGLTVFVCLLTRMPWTEGST